jgi:RNA polymerase sigma-70 factor (ECF subfamily)
MDDSPEIEDPLVAAVRLGDAHAWQTLIERFEGRLLAFARTRIGDRESSEDIVQETFVGFLTSLPNYDSRRPLESYLFSICAYKIADHLRRQGRRPVLQVGHGGEADDPTTGIIGGRVASSIARSVERKRLEETAIVNAVSESIARWKQKGEWTKLQCMELLLVVGLPNREVAEKTGLTEQQVANYKSDFLIRLKSTLTRAGLDSEVFPELQK